MGHQPGLTEYTLAQTFDAAINKVMLQYTEDNPDLFTGITVGDIQYQITNFRVITAPPIDAWEVFWANIEDYGYRIGDCWALTHIKIPAEGENGTAYLICTIVTGEKAVRFAALKGDVTSLNTRSVTDNRNSVKTIFGSKDSMQNAAR
jgi:hypothetical protein